jgi:hypothetical protein
VRADRAGAPRRISRGGMPAQCHPKRRGKVPPPGAPVGAIAGPTPTDRDTTVALGARWRIHCTTKVAPHAVPQGTQLGRRNVGQHCRRRPQDDRG